MRRSSWHGKLCDDSPLLKSTTVLAEQAPFPRVVNGWDLASKTCVSVNTLHAVCESCLGNYLRRKEKTGVQGGRKGRW